MQKSNHESISDGNFTFQNLLHIVILYNVINIIIMENSYKSFTKWSIKYDHLTSISFK